MQYHFKTDFEELQTSMGKSKNNIKSSIASIIKGQQNAYHIINNYKSEEFTEDYYIINFKDIFSIPIELGDDLIAKKNGKR